MMKSLQLGALLSLLLVGLFYSGIVAAQTAPLSQRLEAYEAFSGFHQAPENAVALAYQTTIRVDGAPWLRLIFSDANLGRHSYLLVRSLLDGAEQRIDAAGLAQWENTSAYFNGEALEVRLFVAPGDSDVFIRMNEIIVGEHGAPESQCGPTDDRTPSNDPKAGRLLSVGCTAWLISDGRFISAGHCITSAGSTNTVQFNVPPSLPSGTIQHPGPADQYTVDDASRVFVNGGVGNDWGVFETFANAQTGLTALQAQGASFNLVQNLGPAVIRITGYGVDGGTANQTQQTHAGPNANSSGTTMRYMTDTEPGNSGSPVIDDATGNAVGVHSHGGCTTAGTGSNSGTSLFNTAFWAQVGGAAGGDLEVSCTPVDPPIVIPAGGGTFSYLLEVTNNSASTETFDLWTEFTGPGTSRTMGPFERTLASGAVFSRSLTQRVRGSSASGTYTLTCAVGDYPDSVDEDSFTITKSGLSPVGLVETWTSTEEFAAMLDGPETASVVAGPEDFALLGNYPNPFSESTRIRFSLPEAEFVRVIVYDALGREVATLVDGFYSAGSHEVEFVAGRLSPGAYAYVVRAVSSFTTRRMTIVE